MNNKEISTKNVQTMSSMEIVTIINGLREEGSKILTHDNFMKKIIKVLGVGGVVNFNDTYVNQQNGQSYPCFALPRREANLMVMSESYKIQAAVYDKMTELEEKVLLIAKPYESVSTEKLKEFRLVSPQLAINYLSECGVDTSCLQNKENVATASRTGYVIPSAEASILRLFENCPAARTERNIIQSKLATNPFKNMTGNRSNAIRSTLKDMVDKGIITNIWKNGANRYSIAA